MKKSEPKEHDTPKEQEQVKVRTKNKLNEQNSFLISDLHITARGADRRKKMLSTAARLFREHGYAGVSINEVVRQSGGSLSTAYKSFGNKEGLFLAVFEETMRLVSQKVRSMEFHKSSLQEELESLIRAMYAARPDSLMRAFLFDGINIQQYKSKVLGIIEECIQTPFKERITQMSEKYNVQFRIPHSDLALILVRLLRGTIMEMAIDPAFNTTQSLQATQLTTSVILSFAMNSSSTKTIPTE